MKESKQTIAFGIVGCGKVAHLHARALQNLPQARLVGVHSRSQDSASTFAKVYGVEVFDTVESLVRDGKAAVVIVCTPHPQHVGPTLEAIGEGAHVLVEKPLASSLEDSDRMIEAARRKSRVLGMVSQRRLFPCVRRLRRAVEEGKLGEPSMAIATLLGWRGRDYYASNSWRGSWSGEGGGVLLNQGSHLVDLMQWIMGPVAEVSGFAANINHPFIEVEDAVAASLRFRNGGVGSLVFSNAHAPALYGRLEVSGRTGSSIGIQTDGGEMFLPGQTAVPEPPRIVYWNVPGEEGFVEAWNAEDAREFLSADPTVTYHQLQLADFLDAVVAGREPMVSGEEGRKSVEIIQKVYTQHHSRRQPTAAV